MRQSNSPADPREERARLVAAKDGPLRRRILGTYASVEQDFLRAPDTIARAQRGARELPSAERRLCGDIVYELLRFRRKLQWATKSEAPDALLDAYLAGAATEKPAGAVPPESALAIDTSFPDWLADRLCRGLDGDEARRLLDELNRRAPLTVRANRLKCDRDALAKRLLAEAEVASQPTVLAPDGLTLLSRQNVYELAAFRDGWMELQDEGSQLVAELVAPPPQGTVVDACAGAGGKTLAIAALMKNRGRIVAFDIRGHALVELKRRARRAGLSNLRASEVEFAPPPSTAPADRVLVDAPCSGLGVLRRNPQTKWAVSERDLVALPKRQRAILEAYAPLARPGGGRLIYATCSILADENDAVVDGFLADHPEFSAVPAKEILGKERALTVGDGDRLRLLPHRHGTDGFFAAVMRRR